MFDLFFCFVLFFFYSDFICCNLAMPRLTEWASVLRNLPFFFLRSLLKLKTDLSKVSKCCWTKKKKKKVKDPLNCTVVKKKQPSTFEEGFRSSEREKKKRLLAPFVWRQILIERLVVGARRFHRWSRFVSAVLLFDGKMKKKKKAMQTWAEASGGNCWLGFGLRARTVVMGSLFA